MKFLLRWQIILITLLKILYEILHLYIENKIIDDICCLGKENISTFDIDIVNKLNSLNKHIN